MAESYNSKKNKRLSDILQKMAREELKKGGKLTFENFWVPEGKLIWNIQLWFNEELKIRDEFGNVETKTMKEWIEKYQEEGLLAATYI